MSSVPFCSPVPKPHLSSSFFPVALPQFHAPTLPSRSSLSQFLPVPRPPVLCPRVPVPKSLFTVPHPCSQFPAPSSLPTTPWQFLSQIPFFCTSGDAMCVFLHESRHYVCRFCTSHLGRVKKELLYRLRTKQTKQTPKHPPNQKPKPTKAPKERKQPVAQLTWPCKPRERR